MTAPPPGARSHIDPAGAPARSCRHTAAATPPDAITSTRSTDKSGNRCVEAAPPAAFVEPDWQGGGQRYARSPSLLRTHSRPRRHIALPGGTRTRATPGAPLRAAYG
eukprot:355266-Chlamydomonas_euryale.AAC.3